MALADILQAITAEADAQIAEVRTAHDVRMKELKASQTKALADARLQAQHRRDSQLQHAQMLAKNQAAMHSRHVLLALRQEKLSAVYESVVEMLARQPEAEIERFLQSLLKDLPADGVIFPSAPHADIIKKLARGHEIGEPIAASKGGFRYAGLKQNRDCTFEFLVREILRPETEITAASSLFVSR